MVNLEHGIDSLTNFKRRSADYLKQLRESGEPVVLTVNGKAEVVIQDAAAYQELLDKVAKAEREETIAAIRAGLDDVNQGRTRPARETLRKLARKYGISVAET